MLVCARTDRREPQAFLSTRLDGKLADIPGSFVSRWRAETTFQEVRRHLGVETQRQWSNLAILRATPALLGLFSLITLRIGQLTATPAATQRPQGAAWHDKREPTFSDAIVAVRRVLWCLAHFSMSRPGLGTTEIVTTLLHRPVQTVCYAA